MLRKWILSSLFTQFSLKTDFYQKSPDFYQKRGKFEKPVVKRLFPSDSRSIFAPAFSKIGAAN